MKGVISSRTVSLRFCSSSPVSMQQILPRNDPVLSFPPSTNRSVCMGERVARETTPLPVESSENLNSYAIAQAQFDAAAQYVEIPDGLREYLRHTSRLTTVEFP